ncbi:MAG: hypothetical protein Q9163_002162 [Psora crenata]
MRHHLQTSFLVLGLLHPYTLIQAASPSSDEHKDLKPCTIYNPSNGNFYDLNTIRVHPLENHKKTHKDDRIESWHVRGWDYGLNFTMNFCAPVIEDLSKEEVEGVKGDAVKNISAFYRAGDKTYSIGQASAEPFFRGHKLILNYTNGSPCGEEPSRLSTRTGKEHDRDKGKGDEDREDDDDRNSHKPRRKSTLISFICDRDSLAPKAHISFIGASSDQCTYFFEARSMAACGGVIAAQQSLSPGSVFGIIALIAAAVYLLGGIAYQRTVMHQRGWKQLPNYTLWAGIFGFLKDLFIILTSSCARFIPRRRGYNRLPTSGRGRRDDEANGLIDSYDEEY